jgi:hypothetical protein
VGQARLAEISCADLVWKMRIVTFISSSFGQSLGCLFLYEPPFVLVLPPAFPFTFSRQDIVNVDLITTKPTSYFLIQFPLSSVMNLSLRVAPRISPAVRAIYFISDIQRLTEMPCQMTSLMPSWDWDPPYRVTVSHWRVWKLPANIHFWFTFAQHRIRPSRLSRCTVTSFPKVIS